MNAKTRQFKSRYHDVIDVDGLDLLDHIHFRVANGGACIWPEHVLWLFHRYKRHDL